MQAACAQAGPAGAGAASVYGAGPARLRAPPGSARLPDWAPDSSDCSCAAHSRGRTPIPSRWVSLGAVRLFGPDARRPAAAGPYPLPTSTRSPTTGRCVVWVVAFRPGATRMARGRARFLAVGVGDRRPAELLVGILQGPPTYVV